MREWMARWIECACYVCLRSKVRKAVQRRLSWNDPIWQRHLEHTYSDNWCYAVCDPRPRRQGIAAPGLYLSDLCFGGPRFLLHGSQNFMIWFALIFPQPAVPNSCCNALLLGPDKLGMQQRPAHDEESCAKETSSTKQRRVWLVICFVKKSCLFGWKKKNNFDRRFE